MGCSASNQHVPTTTAYLSPPTSDASTNKNLPEATVVVKATTVVFDDTQNQKLFDAARDGNLTDAREAIENEANVNWINRNCRPLHIAASNGHRGIVILLLASGADPNLTDQQGDTPLQRAARSRHRDIMALLLDRKADLNLADEVTGSTPLHHAASAGHSDIVALLLERGANPNLTSKEQWLYDAAEWGNLTEVVAAVEKGANMNWPNPQAGCHAQTLVQDRRFSSKTDLISDEGKTPLHIAIDKGHHGVVSFLLERGADPNQSDKEGCTPLLAATRKNRGDFVALLLERAADPNLADKNGKLPIHEARSRDRTAIVHLLSPDQRLFDAAREGDLTEALAALDKGADANWKNTDEGGAPPMNVAAVHGFYDIVALLLEQGGNPNLSADSGRSALHIAARHGRCDIIALLLQHGANPNLTDEDGALPARLARGNDHTAAVHMLCPDQRLFDAAREGDLTEALAALDKGADANWKNTDECVALLLESAATGSYNLGAIVGLLLKRAANPNSQPDNGRSALHVAASHGHGDVVALLLERGANPDLPDEDGALPVQIARENNHSAVVHMLCPDEMLFDAVQEGNLPQALVALGKGANVNWRSYDKTGSTVLHAAFRSGHLDMVLILLNRGADPNLTTKEGDTLLHTAARSGNHNIVTLLLQRGADPNLANQWGYTPLHWAASCWGHGDIAALLLQRGADANLVDKDGKKPVDIAREQGQVDTLSLLEHGHRIEDQQKDVVAAN